MKKPFLKMMLGMLLLTIGLSGISCSRDKAKDALPPEHAKMMEAYRKGDEGTKKIVVAKVNDKDISAFSLIGAMNTIAPQYIKPGQKRTPEIDEQVKKEALDWLIYRELAIEEAVKQGMSVPPEKIDQSLKNFRADLNSEEAFRQRLEEMGMTEEEIRKQIERSILIDMIVKKEVFDKIRLDPGLIKKTYEGEKASYKGPSGQMSFEEARPAIERKLMAPLVQKREAEWMNALRKKARIEIAG